MSAVRNAWVMRALAIQSSSANIIPDTRVCTVLRYFAAVRRSAKVAVTEDTCRKWLVAVTISESGTGSQTYAGEAGACSRFETIREKMLILPRTAAGSMSPLMMIACSVGHSSLRSKSIIRVVSEDATSEVGTSSKRYIV